MKKQITSFCVGEQKIKASMLLKFLRSDDSEKALSAAKRFKRLPEFTDLSLDEIMQARIQRKHALLVIATEKGFGSWSELKCQLPFIRGGFLNDWYANYNEAKTKLEKNGGYLLPYQKQYFICDAAYITNLGLDPEDTDWSLIGFDWARPKDKEAWQRLYQEWMNVQEKAQ